ncbi:MAG: LEA type 2 family protein [Pseudomonadales bacterium]
MTTRPIRYSNTIVLLLLLLGGCTSMQMRDPLQISVAGIEPLPSEGLELRLLVKLRVQNPNDVAVDYNGVALQMRVLGETFATGVSDTEGTVPRFGEAVVAVPITASAFRMVLQGLGVVSGKPVEKIDYELTGKLNRSMFDSVRFETQGAFDLPAAKSAP